MAENEAIAATASEDDSTELEITADGAFFFLDGGFEDEEYVEFRLSIGGAKSTQKATDIDREFTPVVMNKSNPQVRLSGPLRLFATKSVTNGAKALKYYTD